MRSIIEKHTRFLGGYEPSEVGVAQSNNFDRCAYDLDGATEYFANNTPQNLGIGNSFTVSAWVKNDAFENGDVVWDFSNSDSSERISLRHFTGNKWLFAVKTQPIGLEVFVTADTCNADATWHHVVCVKDGTNNMLIYHDGLVLSGNVVGSQQTTSDIPRQVCLGAKAVGKTNLLSGKLHSVAVWDVALSSEEINAIFMRGQGSIVDLKYNIDMGYGVTYRSAPNLQHWWRLGYDQSDIGKDYGYSSTLIDVAEDAAGIGVTDISQFDPRISGMNCDGATEYLSNLTLQPYGIGNSFTVAIWCGVDTWNANVDVLFECKTDSGFGNNTNVIDIFNFVKFIYFRVGDGDGNTVLAYTPDTNMTVNNTSICLVGVKDETNAIHLYVNGALVGTETTDIPETTDVNRHCEIFGDDSSAALTDGRPHAAAMWDKALTAAEIKTIYNSGFGTINLSKSFGDYVSHGNLKHWWWCGVPWGKPQGSTTGYEFGLDLIPNENERINVSTNSANLTHENDERNFALGAPYGVCVSLDGSSEYFANTTEQSIGIGNTFSISAWCFNTNPSTLNGGIIEIGKAAAGTTDEIVITQQGSFAGDPLVVLLESSKYYSYNAALASANTWYHVVVTWDGTDLKLYRNAEELTPIKIVDNPTTINGSDRRVLIGYSPAASAYWNGRIAHVAIWDSVLTATEVAQIYSGNLSIDLTADHNAYTSSANLQHYWKIGEDCDDIGKDYGNASNLIDINENSSNLTYYPDIIGDCPRHGS